MTHQKMMVKDSDQKPKLLITGGCGKIGSYFARFAAGHYVMRLVDKVGWDENSLGPCPGESLILDLAEYEACKLACDRMDMVLHLAADASPEADFRTSLLNNNLIATYNMFQAANEMGCKRFLFASSIHTVASYPKDMQVRENDPVQPTSMYGVSKCFGEALAAHYGINKGLPSIAIRIGAYLFPEEIGPEEMPYLDAYLHPDDFNHLLIKCLETPDIIFAIAHAISNNRFKRIDITQTQKTFQYSPQYDAYKLFNVVKE